MALNLLTKKGAKYTEYNASVNPDYRAEMMQKSGRHTFPQIFVGATHVGGCDDLHALDDRGGLDKLLNG
jgi:glutaredoxin 3